MTTSENPLAFYLPDRLTMLMERLHEATERDLPALYIATVDEILAIMPDLRDREEGQELLGSRAECVTLLAIRGWTRAGVAGQA